MDAITQLIESYVSRRATPSTQQMAWTGLRYAAPNLVEAFRDGTSRSAREGMAMAALLSGIALANSGLGMAHGVAAALGVHCKVPHGLACAVMLPTAIEINMAVDGIEKKFAEIALGMLDWFSDLDLTTPVVPRSIDEIVAERRRKQSAAGIEKIESLLTELKIPRRLSEIGVTPEQIPAIVRDSRGNSMSGNPRELSDEELTRILEEML
jgi:alcohol dehydrogenase class IV